MCTSLLIHNLASRYDRDRRREQEYRHAHSRPIDANQAVGATHTGVSTKNDGIHATIERQCSDEGIDRIETVDPSEHDDVNKSVGAIERKSKSERNYRRYNRVSVR